MAHMRINCAPARDVRQSVFQVLQERGTFCISRASQWTLAIVLALAQFVFVAQEVSAAPPINPNPPTSVSAAANSSSQITVFWNDPNSGTGNESGYEVQRVVPPSTSWVTVYTAGPNITSWVNTGLAASTTYSYRVRAYVIQNRKTNYSAYSPVGSATTQAVVIGSAPVAGAVTPYNVAFGAYVGSSFSLSTTFSSTSAVTSCQYTADGGNWLAATVSGVAPNFTCSKTGIAGANGQVLTLNMRATNSTGTGNGAAISRTVDALAPSSGSSAPANWVAADQVVALAGNDSGGSGVASTQYCTDTVNACSPSATGTSAVVSCATGSVCQTYVRFRSTDNVGNVEAPKSALVRIDKSAPSTGSLFASAGNGQVSLSWSGVSDAGSGLSLSTPYKLVFGTGSAPACNAGTVLVNGIVTSFSHSGLSNGVTYFYRMCATDAAGNVSLGAVASATPQGATGNQPPVANVTPSSVSTQTLLPIAFSGSGSSDPDGSIVSYFWNFGDGTTGSGMNVSRTYMSAGSYTAVLTVTDNLGMTAARSVPVTVLNRPPVANAGADQTVSAGSTATLSGSGSSDSDGSISSYVWSFGDGTANGSGASVSHVYATAGTYTASVTVTDNKGASSTDTAIITVTNTTAPGGGSFSWVKRYGGVASSAIGYSTTVDPSGNIIVVGSYWGTVNLGGSGLPSLGSSDIFVAKYASDGTHLWSKTFGGTLDDVARSVTVDTSGNIYVSGSFKRTLSFGGASLTAYYTGFGMETSDLFVTKLTSSGAHVWSKSYGSFADDSANGIAVDDRDGSVVIVGSFGGVVTLGGANLQSSTGTLDIFMAKYSSTGAHVWSKKYGSVSDDVAGGVAIDSNGNIVLVGTAQGSADFGGGLLAPLGAADVVVAKFDANALHLWSKQVGSNSTDAGFAVALDGVGDVFVTGYVQNSGNYGGGSRSAVGAWDTFLVKYSASGAHLWSKQFGGSSVDEGLGLATDGSGNVILTGAFQGASSYDGTAVTSAGSWDIVVSKFSGAGSPVWTKRFGGLASDLGYATATNSAGDVFIVGGVGGVVDFGGGLLPALGSTDMFLLKLRP